MDTFPMGDIGDWKYGSIPECVHSIYRVKRGWFQRRHWLVIFKALSAEAQRVIVYRNYLAESLRISSTTNETHYTLTTRSVKTLFARINRSNHVERPATQTNATEA